MATDSTIAQVAPAATILTDAYTVPTAKRTAAYVVVTNRSAVAVAYRIAIAENGAADSNEQYVVYDATVSTIPQATRRMALGAGDVIRVYAATTDVNFCVNGIEQDV